MSNLISVCIPVYNGSTYIEATLNSITHQSYKNIEILIGDNCSTDDTYDKLLAFAQKDDRIKIFRHRENKGFAGNINFLIENATSDLIAIYHADDIYESNMVEEELCCISQSPDIGAVFTKMRYLNQKNTFQDKLKDVYLDRLLKAKSKYVYHDIVHYLIALMVIGNFFTCPSMMLRKKAYYKASGLREDYVGNQDLDFWLRILDSGYHIGYVRRPLLNYRTSKLQGSAMLERQDYGVLRKNQLKLIDFYLDKYRQRINSKFIKMYQQRKSRIYLDIAWHKLKNKDRSFREDYAISIAAYQFSLFNKIGIKQRLVGSFQ